MLVVYSQTHLDAHVSTCALVRKRAHTCTLMSADNFKRIMQLAQNVSYVLTNSLRRACKYTRTRAHARMIMYYIYFKRIMTMAQNARVCTHSGIYTRIHTRIYSYTRIRTYTRGQTHAHAKTDAYADAYAHTNAHGVRHTPTNSCICTYTRTRTNTCI